VDGFSARYMSDQDQRTHVQWWFYRAQLLRGLLFCLSMRRTASNDSAGAEAATAGEEEAQPEASAVDSDQDKVRSLEGRKIYAERKQTVEPAVS